MFASLLPGFRDVRSSLVAGYMWVSAAWLLAGGFWPDPADRGRLLSDTATSLLDLFGSGGALLVFSLLCLLVGECTSSAVQNGFLKLSRMYLDLITPSNLADPPKGWLSLFRPLSYHSISRLYAFIVRTHDAGADPLADRHEAEQMAIRTIKDVLNIAPRLIIAKPELYAEFDRIRSESEFRDAILLPLPIVVAAVLVNTNLPLGSELVAMALTLLGTAYLFRQSRHKFMTAHSIVAHSIADGTIKPATKDWLAAAPAPEAAAG